MEKQKYLPGMGGMGCKTCEDRMICSVPPTEWNLSKRESEWALLRILRCKASKRI